MAGDAGTLLLAKIVEPAVVRVRELQGLDQPLPATRPLVRQDGGEVCII